MTVVLRISVYAELPCGRWVWRPAGPDFPDTTEDVRSSAELTRALYVYSALVARMLRPVDAPLGFRLTAHARGIAVGLHQWHVSAETGRFAPSAAPLSLLDQAYDSLTLPRQQNSLTGRAS